LSTEYDVELASNGLLIDQWTGFAFFTGVVWLTVCKMLSTINVDHFTNGALDLRSTL
jgi:hypothetical protein